MEAHLVSLSWGASDHAVAPEDHFGCLGGGNQNLLLDSQAFLRLNK